jgi:regulator of ribonuclease activity A
VLVVDAGGSLRCAVLGDIIAGLAVGSGWAGVVIHGAIRDVERLRGTDLGILALGSNPRRGDKAGTGTRGEPVSLGGVTFKPGDVVYADEDGLVVLPGVAV